MRSQEESGAVRKSQEESGAVRRSQEESGGVRKSQEQSGRVRKSQEQSGGVRRSQEESGGVRGYIKPFYFPTSLVSELIIGMSPNYLNHPFHCHLKHKTSDPNHRCHQGT